MEKYFYWMTLKCNSCGEIDKISVGDYYEIQECSIRSTNCPYGCGSSRLSLVEIERTSLK